MSSPTDPRILNLAASLICGFSCRAVAQPLCPPRWDDNPFLGGLNWSDQSGDSIRATALLPNGDLVVAGEFLSIGGTSVLNIARWDGIQWHPMGFDGPNGQIRCLAVMPDGSIVAGGCFDYIEADRTRKANNIARYDWEGWSFMGDGLRRRVEDLELLPDGRLAAGIWGNEAEALNDIQVWDGVSWAPLGNSPSGPTEVLHSLRNGDLIAAGAFDNPAFTGIARWDGLVWSPLGEGLDGFVHDVIELPNGDLLAGGYLALSPPSTPSHGIARWDGSTWQREEGPSLVTRFLQVGDTEILVGGNFGSQNGDSESLALITSGSWTSLLPGIELLQGVGYVHSLLADQDGSVIVGGDLTKAGCVQTNNIARLHLNSCCRADMNQDGIADNGDIIDFVSAFLNGSLDADQNGDCLIDNGDIIEFIDHFLEGC